MSRPYQLPPWSQNAVRELIDLLNCLNNGYYSGPGDLADTLERVSESTRHLLDPTEFNDQLPELLQAVAVLYIALQVAATEHATAAGHTEHQPAVVERWLRSAIATTDGTPGDQQRDLIAGTLHRLQQLREPEPRVILQVGNRASAIEDCWQFVAPMDAHLRLKDSDSD
jgi:hypothetical protein